MKKVIGIILTIVCVGVSAFAQENQRFSNPSNPIKHNMIGSFGGPILISSPLNNNFNLGIGGGGGIVINDFYIGVFGIGQTFQNSLMEVTQETKQVNLGYGGLWLGYSFYNDYKLHPFVSLRSGLGSLALHNNQDLSLMRQNMVVLTPEMGLEFNVTDKFRIASTVGYRWLSSFDERKLPKENYSGITLNLALRVVIN
ncbi:MAG: hypothetical protein HC803_06175 [Saprospiraceae bacterium]|nr:hypothetical protein [Saprospiraceae bacterium]